MYDKWIRCSVCSSDQHSSEDCPWIRVRLAVEDDGIRPEVCIILTDLMGTFPRDEPDYPVVWANVLDTNEAPFGETIHLVE